MTPTVLVFSGGGGVLDATGAVSQEITIAKGRLPWTIVTAGLFGVHPPEGAEALATVQTGLCVSRVLARLPVTGAPCVGE